MAWIDDYATSLGMEPLSSGETTALLDAARDVAHHVERRVTPLSTFLLGLAIGSGSENDRAMAISEAVAVMRSTFPEHPEDTPG